VDASKVRTVALIGHGDSGKTTFVEHALHKAGVIGRVGTVQEGTTTCDFDADEKDRQHSIDVACAHLPWKGVDVRLIDCPGYPDFRGVASFGLAAADTAVMFVNAASGLGVNTRAMWKRTTEEGQARIVVISKMDLENADPEAVLEKLRRTLKGNLLPYNLPKGVGKSFSGVVRCVGAGSDTSEAGLFGDPDEVRRNFIEAVVESDDALMEKYLDEVPITPEERRTAFRQSMRDSSVVPVVFLSSTQGGGVAELLDLIDQYAPSAQRPGGIEATDGQGNPHVLTQDGPFVASVFKVTSDVHVGKLAFLRVWGGTLPADGAVWSSDKGGTLKLAHPQRPQGKELEPATDIGPGSIFCVAKIEELHLGGTVCSTGHQILVHTPKFRPSMVQLAVSPKARGDEHKIGAALNKICDEDPCFHAGRDPETNDLVVSGRSSLHLETMLKRMASRYHVDVDRALPRVPLKETVTAKADGHHRHKKQTGGRGQFAEVFLRMAPTERGAGFEFANKTVGGSIPTNFIPAIEKGIREIMLSGVMAGYRVVDVRVEIYDGKFHPVDSSEAAFKMAGKRAFRDAFEKARPALLEPIVVMEVDIPSRYMGDITGDLNTRRGRIQGMDSDGDHQMIKAQIPLREVQTYSTDLRSITSGEGTYTLEYSHLDVVPSQLAKQIMEAWAKSGGHGEE
jgi:elongation factor G